METPCLLLWAVGGLIPLENESGLLFAPLGINDSASIAELNMLDGTLLYNICIDSFRC